MEIGPERRRRPTKRGREKDSQELFRSVPPEGQVARQQSRKASTEIKPPPSPPPASSLGESRVAFVTPRAASRHRAIAVATEAIAREDAGKAPRRRRHLSSSTAGATTSKKFRRRSRMSRESKATIDNFRSTYPPGKLLRRLRLRLDAGPAGHLERRPRKVEARGGADGVERRVGERRRRRHRRRGGRRRRRRRGRRCRCRAAAAAIASSAPAANPAPAVAAGAVRRVVGAQGPADEVAASCGDRVAQEDRPSRERRNHLREGWCSDSLDERERKRKGSEEREKAKKKNSQNSRSKRKEKHKKPCSRRSTCPASRPPRR